MAILNLAPRNQAAPTLQMSGGQGGFDDELRRRMEAARAAGWSEDEINRSALIERSMNGQRTKQQQAQQQVDQAEAKKKEQPSGWKKFAVNAGALVASTAAGIGAVAAAPVTGGVSLAGGFAAGAGIEAMRRKMLGEEQSVGGSLVEGGLTVIPGIGQARRLMKGAKAAEEGVTVARTANTARQTENATTRTAQIVPKRVTDTQKSQNTFDPFAKPQQAETPSYQASHRPNETGPAGHEIGDMETLRKQIVQGSHSSRQFDKIQRFQGNPDATVKVYRTSPEKGLNDGDWITTDRDYALRQKKDVGGDIHSYTVKAKDLRYNQGDNSGNGFNFGYYPNGQPATAATAPVSAVTPSPATEVFDPFTQTDAGNRFTRNIREMFQPAQTGVVPAIGRSIESGGSGLRARGRGVLPGMKPDGEPARLTTRTAAERNAWLDANAGGSAQNQMAKTGTAKDQAAAELDAVLERTNQALKAGDLQNVRTKALTDIQGVNGRGIPGYDPKLHTQVVEGYDRLLNTATDLKGLTNFKRSLDSDVLNYGRNAASADPIREQLATKYRQAVNEKIKELDPKGEIAAANTKYAAAQKAENALIASRKLNPTGVMPFGTSMNGQGLGGSSIQALQDRLGNAAQVAGRATNRLASPAAQQLAYGAGLRAFGGTWDGNEKAMSPEEQAALEQAMATAQGGAMPFAEDSQDADEQAMNQLAASGATTFDDYANGILNLENPSTDGNNGMNDGAGSDALFQMAIDAYAAGDAKASDQYMQLAEFASKKEQFAAKLAAQGQGSGKGDAAQQKATTAAGAIDQLEGAFKAAGGGQGVLGFGQQVLGKLRGPNPEVEAYDKLAQSAAVSIARAMGEIGPLSNQDITMYASMLPKVTDSSKAAQIKINFIRERLAGAAPAPSGFDFNTVNQMMMQQGGGASFSPFDEDDQFQYGYGYR